MPEVASLSATHPRSKNFVEELWNTPTPDGLERYYEGLLYMMSLLHCSGEFRVWGPESSNQGSTRDRGSDLHAMWNPKD